MSYSAPSAMADRWRCRRARRTRAASDGNRVPIPKVDLARTVQLITVLDVSAHHRCWNNGRDALEPEGRVEAHEVGDCRPFEDAGVDLPFIAAQRKIGHLAVGIREHAVVLMCADLGELDLAGRRLNRQSLVGSQIEADQKQTGGDQEKHDCRSTVDQAAGGVAQPNRRIAVTRNRKPASAKIAISA